MTRFLVSFRQGCVNGSGRSCYRRSSARRTRGRWERRAKDSSGIEAVRTQFEDWRRGRARKSPIPDELWSAAIDAARKEGGNRTAQQLRLDAGKLKRLLVAADGRGRRARESRDSWN